MSRFCFDARSHDAVVAAGTDMRTVLAALHGEGPQIRRHRGSGDLHLYASTPDGRWLAMAFVETDADDEWLLTKVSQACVGSDSADPADRPIRS